MKSWGMKVPSPYPKACYPKACTSKPSFLAKVGVHSENQARRNLKMTAYSCKSCVPIVPLRFETSAGQAMLQTMRTTPHLLPVAIDRQLVQLQSSRVVQKKEILEEIIYCLVVNKFVENDILMIPSVNIDSCPNYYQEKKLKAFHSTDALDMIESHLTFLAERLVGHVSKQKLRKFYAANIKFGYYLKGVDVRFQLDRSMNMLPAIDDDDDLHSDPFWDTESTILHDCEEGDNMSYGLRTYVRHMDEETLRRYATIRSKEAVSLIEKQEQALFGRHDASSDEVVGNRITSCLVKMLAMEAVAFGCFLWEAECYIQSKCGCLSS